MTVAIAVTDICGLDENSAGHGLKNPCPVLVLENLVAVYLLKF